jgi:large subunit ribosomal protein L15
MLLHDLKPAKGANKEKKRLGRGTGSGLGTTAGKGHKGQKARSGGTTKPGFEGGQMPMSRRIPKRGFSNARFKVEYEIVNLKDIEQRFTDGAEVSLQTLKAVGLSHGNKNGVKVLATGVLSKKLNFTVDKVSEAARTKIEAVGGAISLIPPFKESVAVKERKEARAARKQKSK